MAGIGTGVSLVSLLRGSLGYCTAGDTMPRMKPTSDIRRARLREP